jgi:hypothetical protein
MREPPPRECSFETPLLLFFHAVVTGLHRLYLSKGTGLNKGANLEEDGIEVEPVADHEVDVVGAASVDHVAALGGGNSHGLLTEDMLAGFGGADGVLAVHRVGERDVDGVNGFVVSDVVIGFVGIDGVGGDAVLIAKLFAFVGGVSCDETAEGGDLGLRDRAHEDLGDAA